MVKQNRGRIAHNAPNAEPTFQPDPPKRLVFGAHQVCPYCKGKGRKGGQTCKACSGTGIIEV